MRGVPTKSKIVWEKLVDLKKVWNVLVWLKANNPLYSKIVLPQSHDLLLNAKLPDTEFQEEVVANDNNNDNNESIEDVEGEILNIDENIKRALLTQMSQSDSYYDQFTIYPMYDKRGNESATALYQMLIVHDIPLGHPAEHLDVKCFPDLYPYAMNGQHEERLVRLTDQEFIKSKLMSKHSQFRLNMQYCRDDRVPGTPSGRNDDGDTEQAMGRVAGLSVWVAREQTIFWRRWKRLWLGNKREGDGESEGENVVGRGVGDGRRTVR